MIRLICERHHVGFYVMVCENVTLASNLFQFEAYVGGPLYLLRVTTGNFHLLV